jgi:hypothetical protein
MTILQEDLTARALLERLGDMEHYPHEGLSPYREFDEGGKTYYFTPGGFLYRKDPGAEELGGFLCGYLPGEVWRYRVHVARYRRGVAAPSVLKAVRGSSS